MSDMKIQSYRGVYEVHIDGNLEGALQRWVAKGACFLVDDRVAELHAPTLATALNSGRSLRIHANEENKSLEQMPKFVESLLALGVRRNNPLIAIGGGIVQDITCFLAATLLRGLPWSFIPTTLLAQADSCIGSKSSINVGSAKNILGTFTPPNEVWIQFSFLSTLSQNEMQSGIGEMLKVHLLNGMGSFDAIAEAYGSLLEDRHRLLHFIRQSLEIKKCFIEEDEFDVGRRNLLNYGHSFGHAVEAATEFAVPHGIAVTLGMDLANFVSWKMGKLEESHYRRIHTLLKQNYRGFEKTPVPPEPFFQALLKDKKNVGAQMGLILWNGQGGFAKTLVERSALFENTCIEFLENERS